MHRYPKGIKTLGDSSVPLIENFSLYTMAVRGSLMDRFDELTVSQVNCPRSVDDEDHTETIIDIFR